MRILDRLKTRWRRSGMVRQAPILAERFRAEATAEARLPFRVRVGVTGHRSLPDERALEQEVRDVLELIENRVLKRSAETPVVYTVVSALAEGADRLVPRVVLEGEGALLEVVLPLEQDDFVHDFETEASRAEFHDLLGRADVVHPPERPEARPEAYATGGHRLVDRVDLLIALWDRQPPRGVGGTATVVEYAAEQKVPTFVIATDEAGRIERPALPDEARPRHLYRILDPFDLWFGSSPEESRLEYLREQYRGLDAFNRERLTRRRFDSTLEANSGYLGDTPGQVGYGPSFADWALPYYVRADVFASFYQWVYTRLAFLVFVFAAGAVTVAAMQFVYFSDTKLVAIGEMALTVAIAFCVWLAHRWRPLRRWIAYRSLAENLRSAPFIAVLDPAEVGGGPELGALTQWFQRAFTEVWAKRPQDPPRLPEGPDPARSLATFFEEGWIGGQVSYHQRRSNEYSGYHHALTLLINLLFLGTFIAALLHVLGVESETLVFLAITLPAFGASLGGYRELREFEIHSERYRRAGERLAQVVKRMRRETDPDWVGRAAAEAYGIMVDENSDWFGVLEFQDLEVVL